MKIALSQINPIVGDLTGNKEKIISFANEAYKLNADLVVFPELSITGYPTKDLVEKQHFIQKNLVMLERIKNESPLPIVVGYVKFNQEDIGKHLYNAAAFICNNEIISIHQKCLLPTYDVFDEYRYFDEGHEIGVFEFDDKTFALTICEDLWNETLPMKRKLYKFNPVDELVKIKPDFVINIAASPYGTNKRKLREEMLTKISKKINAPIIYVNQIGGQDDLVFDGHSFVVNPGGVVFALPGFSECLSVYDTEATAQTIIPYSNDEEEMLNALVLGLKDYLHKCRFDKVILGLSGGIDSALTAAIAVRALGADKVFGLIMPSPFSSDHSIIDAVALSNNLGIKYEQLPINDIYNSYLLSLKPGFENKVFDVTEENIQARIRGNIIMAYSNKFGYLPLATGNKSELSCGYCTLYGDMCGGLGVLGDVYKTSVYKISKFINKDKEIIPLNTLNKPPSAELRENQKDSDSLPEYNILDGILKLYIEEWASVEEIIKAGFEEETVKRVIRLVDLNEYKRRQAAPVIKVSLKAFGSGRRMPIAQGWVEKRFYKKS